MHKFGQSLFRYEKNTVSTVFCSLLYTEITLIGYKIIPVSNNQVQVGHGIS